MCNLIANLVFPICRVDANMTWAWAVPEWEFVGVNKGVPNPMFIDADGFMTEPNGTVSPFDTMWGFVEYLPGAQPATRFAVPDYCFRCVFCPPFPSSPFSSRSVTRVLFPQQLNARLVAVVTDGVITPNPRAHAFGTLRFFFFFVRCSCRS